MVTKQDLEISVLKLQVSIGNLSESILKDKLEEFKKLRKEVDQIKEFLTQKFGVKIAVQR